MVVQDFWTVQLCLLHPELVPGQLLLQTASLTHSIIIVLWAWGFQDQIKVPVDVHRTPIILRCCCQLVLGSSSSQAWFQGVVDVSLLLLLLLLLSQLLLQHLHLHPCFWDALIGVVGID